MRINRLCQAAITLAIASANAAPAFAAGQITFVSQGGAYQEAQTKAILDPAAKQLGITINQDSIPDAWPQIKAQGATGKPIWDVVDTPTSNCLRGGHDGLIEKLDYSKMPNAASIPEKYRTPYSVPYEFYSSVIGYNRKTVKKVPHSWADFWNVKGFPARARCATIRRRRSRPRYWPTACRATSYTRSTWTVRFASSRRSSPTSPCGGPRAASRRSCCTTARLTWR